MNKIEMSKTYKTRDGKAVRVFCIDRTETGATKFPVVGLITDKDGAKRVASWTAIGQAWYYGNHPNDLIEVRPRIKREQWVNVYDPHVRSGIYDKKEDADRYGAPGRIACVKIEIDCEEGEGLS